MSENKESKPRSFRIDDEIAEINEISSVISGNQQQTLAKLIEAYEFQAGKAVLTDKKAEIEEFEKYITAITRKYMGSLEDNQNLSQTIRTEFEAQLKSKDTTIQGLQSQLATTRQVKEEAASKAQMYEDENARLNGVIDSLTKEYNTKMDDLQTMLADKDSLNKALIDSCNELKTKAEGMKKAAEQTATLCSELENLKNEHNKLVHNQADLEKQLQQEQASSKKALEQQQEQSQLALDKAVLKVERKYQKQLQELKEKHQAEIDKYQQKYLTLLEKTDHQGNTEE
ncbi:MAG: hypothetical protein K1W06_11450 [Lachnospiraceae bacterium]